METEIQVVESFEKNAPRNQQLAITPDQMIMKALDKGLSIDQLGQLLDLQERWMKKNAEAAYNDAFAEFQSKKPKLIKSEAADFGNGKAKYMFAPLSETQEKVDPILGSVGLSYRWRQEQANGKIRITCVIKHRDGHSEETWLEANEDKSGGKNDIQSIGSTVSYLKRYTLENALGLSTGKDNDGKDSGIAKKDSRLGISDANWPTFIEKVKAGTIQIDELKASFRLKDSQVTELDKLTK